MSNTNLYQKLTNIQSELKVPKSQRNTFGNYDYRSAEDIKEAVKPLLLSHKSNLRIDTNISLIANGWVYAEAVAIFTDIETGESISVKGYARESETKKGMDPAQISGAASSYAAKYALNGLFLLDDTADADSDAYQHQQNNVPKQNNNRQNNQPPQQQAPQNNKQPQQEPLIDNFQLDVIKKKIVQISNITNVPFEVVSNHILVSNNLNSFEQVGINSFNKFIEYLDNQIAKKLAKKGV